MVGEYFLASKLLECTREGDLQGVLELLKGEDRPPLGAVHEALRHGMAMNHLDIVRFLVAQPSVQATINSFDELHQRLVQSLVALSCSCLDGQATRILLEAGADPTIVIMGFPLSCDIAADRAAVKRVRQGGVSSPEALKRTSYAVLQVRNSILLCKIMA